MKTNLIILLFLMPLYSMGQANMKQLKVLEEKIGKKNYYLNIRCVKEECDTLAENEDWFYVGKMITTTLNDSLVNFLQTEWGAYFPDLETGDTVKVNRSCSPLFIFKGKIQDSLYLIRYVNESHDEPVLLEIIPNGFIIETENKGNYYFKRVYRESTLNK